MKKTKLLSLFLSASLLLHTWGINALAATPSESAPVSETTETAKQDISGQLSAGDSGHIESGAEESLPGLSSEENDDSRMESQDSAERADHTELPSSEDENIQAPAGEETNTEPPTTEGGEAQAPAEENTDTKLPPAEDGDIQAPAGENTDTKLPPAEDGDIQAPAGENTDAELPPAENGDIQDPDGEDTNTELLPTENGETENETTDIQSPADSVSENTISENTVSEDTLSSENARTNIFSIFPGLGEDYKLSSQQLADKKILATHTRDLARIHSAETAVIEDYADAEGEYEPGEVVYLAKTREEAEQVAKAFGGTLDSYSYEVAVIGLPKKATVALAVAAAAEPDIKLPAVWPNYYSYPDASINATTAPLTPSDPGFAEQWQHDYIGTRYAWAAGFKGQGVKVAVIDTGLQQNHEDLSNNADEGKNFVDGAAGTPHTVDNQTHGTHVAGIIAADDNGVGGIGIAPDARVRGYCVFPRNNGARDSDIMRAINAAVEDGNDIINMSLGSVDYSANYEKVVDEAYQKGVAIFAAAGNDDCDGQNYPAAYASTISIGAVDQNGTRASFSNYGSTVNLSFPGATIYSTVPAGYDYMSGTSQASPAASGTAAVILSADASIQKKSGKARVDALLSAMKSSALKCPDSGMGAGTTYLPGVLKLATEETVPETPTIKVVGEADYNRGKNQKDYIAEQIKVTLSTNTALGVDIYYATDGKTPAYKDGAVINAENAEPYILGTEIILTGAKKKTIKAIAVNPISGKASKAVSQTFTLTPVPSGVTITAKDNVSRITAGKALKLTATVTPSYTISNKVAWAVDPKAVSAGVTVSNGTVKTKAGSASQGEYKVTVTATAVGSDGISYNGVAGTYSFTVIPSSDIKKVAFLDPATQKAPAPKTLDAVSNDTNSDNNSDSKNNSDNGGNSKFSLKDCLTVTTATDTLNGDAALEKVVWSSSNPKVATVDGQGEITALAPGKAVIKATSNDGGGKSASYKVTVTQPITRIAIYGPSKVAAGKGITLAAQVTPANATNKKLDWKVENGSDKATISASGKVTAKKGTSGKCTVTATAKDGSGISSAYEITVVSGEITKITLSANKLTLFPPNTSAAETATKAVLTQTVDCTGSDTALSKTLISWASSAPSVAAVDENGNITAKAPGKAIITCAATDGSNKKATCTVNVAIPMSRLVVGPADGNAGAIAVGKKIKMTAKYYSKYGAPASKKIDWKIIGGSDQSLQGNVSIDKNGMVSVSEAVNATSTTNDYIVVQAVAQDGSGVESNLYRLTIRPNYRTARIVFTGTNFFLMATTEKTSPDNEAANWERIPDYCTATISGPKHCALLKTRTRLAANGPIYAAYSPIPVKYTEKDVTDPNIKLYSNEVDKLTLTIKLKDGSNLTAKQTVYAVNFINKDTGNPDTAYLEPRK